MRKNRRNIKKSFKFNILLILLILLIPIILIGMTIAKYIKEEQVEKQYQAKNFYFESDLLSYSSEQPEYTLPQGIDTISFYLKNNADSLRYSEVDIDYEVVLTKAGMVTNTIDGKILKNAVNLSKVEFTNLEPGEYTVTANAVTPYEKTLSAKFILEGKDENIKYQVTDTANSPIIQVKVSTKDYTGDIVITYPEGAIADNTDTKIGTFGNNNITVSFENDSSYTFTFFKTEPSRTFTSSDFTVEKQD